MSSILLTRNKIATQNEKKADEVKAYKRETFLETVSDVKEAEARIIDYKLAQRIGHELVHKYPGHGWQVEADTQNGIIKIFNNHMSGLHAYVWKTADIQLSRISHDVMRIGGEILERFGLSRHKFLEDQVATVKRDKRGTAILDLSK